MELTIYTDDGEYFIFKDDEANQVAVELENLLQGDYRNKWITVKSKNISSTLFMNHVVGFILEQK